MEFWIEYRGISPCIAWREDKGDPTNIHVREVTDEPDLAPGVLKAIEILSDKEFAGFFAERADQKSCVGWLESEATRLGLIKGDAR
jgi:hypothetical protein